MGVLDVDMSVHYIEGAPSLASSCGFDFLAGGASGGSSDVRCSLGAKWVTPIASMALSLGVGGLGVAPPSSNSSCSCSRVRSSSASVRGEG